MHYAIKETDKVKMVKAPGYSYYLRKKDGFFMRWGETAEDDPDFSPIGPEIADIEISTICPRACSHCYKSNTAEGENMSLETFKEIFHKLPRTLTQIAFGIGSIDGNPDLWDIMRYCRENEYNKVVPNITINGFGITGEHIWKLAGLVGAIAVSNYEKDVCYNTVKRLTNTGLKQVNIHQLLSEETYEQCFQVVKDRETDPRLSNMKAVVFLLLKPKGNRNTYHCLKDRDKYKKLVDFCMDSGQPFGFDSCGATAFLDAIKGTDNEGLLNMCADPCESTCFSWYINAAGLAYPCSFSEGCEGIEPINMLEIDNFLEDAWYTPQTVEFREKLLTCGRQCPLYNLKME